MNAKRQLLCASALCGSLFVVSTPAWADCTVTASPDGDVVVCTGTNTGGVLAANGTASFVNDGAITSSDIGINGIELIGSVTNNQSITAVNAGISITRPKADAVITNAGVITVSGAGAVGIRTVERSHIVNSGTIEMTGPSSSTGIAVGDDSIVNNSGTITAAHGIIGGAGANVTNSGSITTSGSGVTVGVNGRIVNAEGATIHASMPAVSLGAGAHLTNAGAITQAGSINATVRMDSDAGQKTEVVNMGKGLIQSGIPTSTAIYGQGAGKFELQNSGRIAGHITLFGDQGATLFNGYTSNQVPAEGPAIITGDITLSAADDFLMNRGSITGDIKLGKGADGLRNGSDGVITGNIDLGSDEDTPDPVGEGETPSRNFLINAGTINGDIIGGEGVDEVELDGVHNGEINLAGGDDLLKFSGTLNGNALMGAGDDMVIVYDRPLLGGGNRIDAEGGDADHLVFNGDGGTWYSEQFGNFEKLTKMGNGRTVLKDTWTGFAEVFVSAGTLVVGGGDNDGLAGALTAVNGGVYLLNGVHYGDITLEDGGVLAGTGSNSAQGVDSVQVRNLSGVVSPGDGGIGTLTLVNDYHQGALGRLDIELGAPGQSDRLVVGGTAHLDGTVRFIPLNLADTGPYVFMQYNAVTGQFATIEGAAGRPGLFYSYSVDYQAGQAVVNVVKTGTATDPDPEPVTGCTPYPAPSGSIVTCVPTLSAPQNFTSEDLDIRVDGMLSLDTPTSVFETSGSNTRLTVLAGGGVVNDGGGAAVMMRGETNHLVNHGVIRAGAAEQGSSSRMVWLEGAAGKTSTVLNGATGVIGHEGVTTTTAIHAEGGVVEIENLGRVHGGISIEGERAQIVNGRYGDNGALQGPSTIDGSISTTSGADLLVNLGTINGAVRTHAGDDRIENRAGALLVGEIMTMEGDDAILLDGVVRGNVDAGEGADLLELYGRLDGDVRMGDGDDRVWIANVAQPGAAPALSAGHVIDGGAGWDRLVFSGANGAWDAAQFTGFELLRKEGGGLTVLTGVWDGLDKTHTGEIASGTLHLAQGAEMHSGLSVMNTGHYRIDGEHLSHVNVQAGGLVTGSGSIGNAARFAAEDWGSLMNGGVVAPGDGIGTLTVWGNYNQGSDGRLDIELGAAGQSDLLDIKGQAVLNGAVQFIPRDAGVTGPYTFLKAAGGVTGNFGSVNPDADLAQQGVFFTYAVDYTTAGQVSVIVNKTGTGPVEPDPDVLDVIANLTVNQQAVRDAFMADGVFSSDLAQVRADLNDISVGKAPRALDSFSGEMYATTPYMAARAGQRFARAVDDRLSGERLGLQEGFGRGTVLWTQVLAETGHQQSDRSHSGYDLDLIGAAIGADAGFGAGLRAGVALGRTEADADQPRLGAEAKIVSNHFGVYGTADFGAAYIDAQAGFAQHDTDATRTLIIGETATRTARGDVEASELRASIRAGYAFEALQATWRPYGSLAFTRVEQDGFVEAGAGDAGLEVDAVAHEATTAAAGVDLAWSVGSLRPYAGVSLSHDLSSEGWSAGSRLIGGAAGARFTVRGAEPGSTAFLGRFGLGGAAGAVALHAGYDIEVRDRYLAHSLTLGARIQW